jgi:hypothetical protein
MTPADDHLRALFALDEPPARDPAFATAVIERMARRRCLQDVALLAGLSAVGGAALWGFWPMLQPALTALADQLAPTAAGLAVAASAVAILTRWPAHVPPLES